MPVDMRRGILKVEWLTRAWISARIGRVPSMAQTTQEPAAFSGRPLRSISEGFSTSARPLSRISNTPISLVEPKRFLAARRMR